MTAAEDIAAFKNHPLWDTTAEFLGELRRSRPRSDIDRATINRTKVVVQYVAAHQSVPAELFPNSRLPQAEELRHHLQVMQSQVQGWDQSAAMTPGTVNQLDGICDTVMATLSRSFWPSLPNPLRATVYLEAAEAYVATAEASLQALLADAELAHTEAQAAQLASSSAVQMVEGVRAEARSTLEDFVAEQTQVTEEWKRLHGEAIQAETEQGAEQRKAWDAMASTQRAQHHDAALKALSALERDAEQGQKLVQRVGDQARAGGYANFARREWWAYRVWIAAGAVAVLCTLAYLAVEIRDLAASNTEPEWPFLLLKTGLSLTALAFSGFSFREAGKRQRNAIEAQYRALDLLALEPFTEGMSDEDANAFRRMLGERIFASPPDPQPKRSEEKITTLRLDVADIKAMADTAKAVKDVASA